MEKRFLRKTIDIRASPLLKRGFHEENALNGS